jgi:hypothetical protein
MNSTIGVSTWSLQPLTYNEGKQLPELIEIMAGMGIDGLDLYDEYLPVYPDTNLHRLNEIKKIANSAGLPITGTWFFNDLLGSYYNTSLDKTVENTKRFLAVTAALDSKYMSVPFLLNVPNISIDDAYDTYLRIFEKLIPVAGDYGVFICAETARQHTPGLALRLHKTLNAEYFTICPDLEAWRFDSEDIPLVHAESVGGPPSQPEPIELFAECLPYAPYIHFKLLSLDETGEEPHFPIPQIMDLINKSDITHHLCIEYEGWIPDIKPNADVTIETRRCVELIKRYQK